MENRLRKLRKQENKTLLQVARFLSISTQSLSAYETGVRDLSTDILCKLADFYGVSVDYILCRDNSAPAPVYTDDPTLKAILDLYDRMTPVQRGQFRAMGEILISNSNKNKILN